MQTLRKKTSPLKYRNEPARFFGDGVVFKAKLIGILEVGEARGDRMCQEALQDLKVAIRAAGEHKQKITIHVTIEGLRLRDEKTGESLYHHPVHKISFIAQDMTDSRSFGYIFGSPDCGHRFFGIKTDKAASQVVLAMRDLFQCVFELKKKEIELAKQHIQNRITAHEHQQVKNSILDHKKPTSLLSEAKSTSKAEKSPEATANLVDLEQELSSIQRGITQMERITPNDDAPTKNPLEDDPFGDSFAPFSSTPFSILPPPASSKRNQPKQIDDTMAELSSIMTKSSTPPIPPFPSAQSGNNNTDSWLNSAGDSSVFDDPESTNSFSDDLTRPNRSFDDNLDPLRTGRSRPYVDKKYFFQDLKNPPKRVLKDLSEQESIFDARFSPLKRPPTGLQGLSLDSSLTASAGGSVFDSMKSIDPFEEEDFSKINLDQFETTNKPSVSPKSIILPDTKISSIDDKPKQGERKLSDQDSFNAPLHVELPPESWASASFSDPRRLDRQGSDSSSRNVFSVDAFSKKLPKPNLFGQRNVKRDSNGINMRRLQESDSLSENEPELPPRPETGSHEPPPLPPKNSRDSYNDSSESRNRYSRTQISSRDNSSRYEYASRFKNQSSDSPPLPLPSRKINRTETSYSSSSKPFRKSNDEDDYMTPNPNQDIPTLLPPPQKKDPSKSRGARKSETDPKNLDAPTPPVSAKPSYEVPSTIAPLLPDITLSQLLTLGIDDLAHKLNVPTSKLNTMTIVELTKYLSEFIEKSKQPVAPVLVPVETPIESPVFKVSFDDANDATFVAKFDDNFGESGDADDNSFVANFENFNQAPVSVIPTADRYAVFREIIDQEMQQQDSFHQESIESNNSNSLEEAPESSFEFTKELDSSFSPMMDSQFKQSPTPVQMAKIDTKITDAISGAKDRYAALRDIILVQDLFDKSAMPPLASISDSNLSDDQDDVEPVFDTAEVADNNSADNVPTYSISWADAEANHSEISDPNQQDDQKSLQIISTSQKDDLEIDEYMKKAISELSLDQRLSPNIQSKSPCFSKPSHSPSQLEKPPSNLNDMSTSPIPITASKSPLPVEKGRSPRIAEQPEEAAVDDTVEERPSTDEGKRSEDSREKTITPNPTDMKPVESSESWANFEQEEEPPKVAKEKSATPTNARPSSKENPIEKESPYSSDGKNADFKQREKEYHRRWPKPHTSSSSRDASRDVSPWDEDGPASGDYRRRPRPPHHHEPPHHHSNDRYARPPGPPRRRINSCDEEYDEEYDRRPLPPRSRAVKPPIHRSKEVLDSENPNWHYPSEHWSEEEDADRSRTFDRNAYERSTYGPPYDKRDPKFPYDRRDYKAYDKRSKYYRGGRNDYDYDPYEMPPPVRGKPPRKEFDDYEGNFERGSRESRSAREYFYDRERKSFDSNESYESGRGHRMGSGEISGSYEGSRGDYRDRYLPQNRSLRRTQRSRGAQEDEDSDEEVPPRRPSGETGSLQRSAVRGSKHIQLDDDVWGGGPGGPGGKHWKRPASATAGDRMSGSGGLSGSDGEKDKRFRRKGKPAKGKEVELRSNYATIRYSQPPRKEYAYEYEEDGNEFVDEPSPRNISPRLQDPEAAAYYARRKHGGSANVRTSTTPRSETKGFSEYSKPPTSRYPEDDEFESRRPRGPGFKKSTSRDLYVDEPKEYYANVKLNSGGFDDDEAHPKRQPNIRRMEFSSEEQPQSSGQPQSNNKFNFDGFESDFNSSPKQPETAKSEQPKFSFESEFSPSTNTSKNATSQQKLRFNENVSVSKFDANSSSQQMFEDDFLEWAPETEAKGANIQSSLKKVPGSNLKTNSVFNRHENIKKSDSVNIFARKTDEDPFADDDFFNDDGTKQTNNGRSDDPFHWSNKNNFANFDDNKNI